MVCHKKTFKKVMASVRNRHPRWGLKRRKHVSSAIIYGRKK
jgi:hypothetical protein